MYNFTKSILDIIDIYTMHCKYKEKNISLTHILAIMWKLIIVLNLLNIIILKI